MPRWLWTPRWLGLLAGLLVVLATCAWLGWWQWERATTQTVVEPASGVLPIEQVQPMGEPVDPRDVGRRVVLRGAYDDTRQLLVVDRLDGDDTGTWVVTAFVLAGSDGATMPVVRGWLPEGESPPPAAEGQVRLVGRLEQSEPTDLRQPGRAPLPDGQVEIVSSAELLSLWQPPLMQGFVLLDRPVPEAPLRPVSSPTPDETTQVDWQNLAYAIQWWLFGLFAIFWFGRMVRLEAEERAAPPTAPDDGTVGTIESSHQEAGR